jgi:Ca-activated chloride channel homolog
VVDADQFLTIAAAAAGAVALLAMAAEALHAARVRRVAALAFGPGRRPLAWAYLAPPLRVLSLAAVAWGLVVLFLIPPTAHRIGEVKPHEVRRLVLVLDVSPSMKLQDAGQQGKQRRDQRAADLLKSFFDRVQKEQYRTTVIAFYTEAKPVVQDTTDLEVVENILTDLPLAQAFKAGQTNMIAGLNEAARIAKPWPPGSTAVLVVSDGGDPAPGTPMPRMPASVSSVVVVGVGNPTVGKGIDGGSSRQDVSSLRQLAARTQGTYHNGNELQLSTELVNDMNARPGRPTGDPWTWREVALLCVGLGAGTLALLPVLLTLVGTAWRPGRRMKRN